jgi:hypothetical protein
MFDNSAFLYILTNNLSFACMFQLANACFESLDDSPPIRRKKKVK